MKVKTTSDKLYTDLIKLATKHNVKLEISYIINAAKNGGRPGIMRPTAFSSKKLSKAQIKLWLKY